MKKYLISESGTFYKANLHCHTNFSDGALSPEEVKDLYVKHGYSIIAFTDHDIFVPHPELNDENFLALHGFEVEVTEQGKPTWDEAKCCHICFIALDETIRNHPLWHRTDYLFGNAPQHRAEVQFDPNVPDYVREYTPERVSDMMRIGRENNFFVTYNHPRWSLEEYPQYINYNNMSAMEICNGTCCNMGFWDYNGVIYDEMLRAGKRIFCTATDDNHSMADTFIGYTMIKAEKLDYALIADALKNGDFYASTGAEINSLWYEDKKVHITFPAAAKVVLSTGIRKQMVCTAPDNDPSAWNEAVFELDGTEKYFRITVLDAEGKTADTNAFFLDALE